VHLGHHHHKRGVALHGECMGHSSGSLSGGKFDTIQKCVL